MIARRLPSVPSCLSGDEFRSSSKEEGTSGESPGGSTPKPNREVGRCTIDEVFKALADPTRREILRLLAQRDMTAGELAACFAMTKPTVSHHFAVLKKAELVTHRKRAQQVVYSLNTTVAQELLAWIYDLLDVGNPPRVTEASPDLARDDETEIPASSTTPNREG